MATSITSGTITCYPTYSILTIGITNHSINWRVACTTLTTCITSDTITSYITYSTVTRDITGGTSRSITSTTLTIGITSSAITHCITHSTLTISITSAAHYITCNDHTVGIISTAATNRPHRESPTRPH